MARHETTTPDAGARYVTELDADGTEHVSYESSDTAPGVRS